MIERSQEGSVLTLTFAHGKASALDLELLLRFTEELSSIGDDVRAVILTGRGSIFSAGVDLFRIVDGGSEYLDQYMPALGGALRTLFELPLPVVAAVNGHAIAGGCIIAQACDYRIMARGNGKIGVPELLVGVPFPRVAIGITRFATPPQHFQRIVYTAKTFTPEEALEVGLVDELADAGDLASRARQMADHFASLPTKAFALTKQYVRAPAIAEIDRGEVPELDAMWRAAETHAGIRAYLEKTIRKA